VISQRDRDSNKENFAPVSISNSTSDEEKSVDPTKRSRIASAEMRYLYKWSYCTLS